MEFTYSIRAATRHDVEHIVSMIEELADYENMLDQCKLTPEQFQKDGFGDHPAFHCLVAEARSKSNNDETKIVGYALFYFTYSSVEGKCLYLEDLYVKEAYRKHGIGGDLMKTAAKTAIEKKCSQYHFACLGWNAPALNFYKASGARDITQSDGWHMIRFELEEMNALADSVKR